MPALLCRFVFFVFSLLLSIAASAQANHAIVELKDNSVINLLPYLSYWQPDQAIDFATASAPESQVNYQPVTGSHLTANGKDFWFRFQLKIDNEFAHQSILNLNDILLEDAELFVQTPTGVTRSLIGLNHPYNQRALAHRYLALPIAIPADSTHTLFIRIKPLSGLRIPFSPTVQNTLSFYNLDTSGVVAAVIGAMAMVLFFMLLVANLILRGRILVVFIAFACSIFLLNISHAGYLSSWFDLNTYSYRLIFVMMPVAMNILTLYFCRYLFDMPTTLPRLNKSIDPFCIAYLLLTLPAVALPIELLPAGLVTTKSTVNGIASLLLLVFGLSALKLKLKGSGYYLLGLFLFIAIVNITRLANLGIGVLSTDLRTLISIASLCLLVCFAVATLQKIRLIAEREKQLEKNSAILENQNRVRTDFLISMSHEIRTPINGVLGMAQMLEKTRLDNGQRYYLDILSSAGRTLLNVVNEILDISKLEAGKLEVESIYFNLDQTINYTAELFGNINRKAGVNFTYESDISLPVHVMGDPARLQQILNNLLSNAFKFTEQGEVSLAIKLIDRISEDRVLLRIEVKDSGIGISEEALGRLFNPFQQADSTTSRRYGGTGLGLAICKKIVELMGGHIHAASNKNEGSRFWADIPFNIAQREEARHLNTTHSIEGKHIAMVLRFPEFNKIYISALDYWQAETTIINPDTATDSLDWAHIDVMYISDMLPMPLLLHWIETAKNNQCPIILANGYGENYRPSDIAESATLRRLQQPMSKARLADMLHQIIHNISPTAAESGNGFSSHNVSSLHLLIAEDNEVNTKVLQALFAKNGINAEFVVNGEQAVKCYCAEPNRFDAILMDCEMPILNGFEATTQIRQFELDNRHPPITIIALTAHALLETRDACMACGMNDILTKPVNFAALLSRLEEVAVSHYA